MCSNRSDRQPHWASFFGVTMTLALGLFALAFVLPRTGLGGVWGLLLVLMLLKFAQSALAGRSAGGYGFDEEDDLVFAEDDDSVEGRLEKLERLRRKELISEGEFAALRERVLEEV